MPKILHLDPQQALETLLEEHPEARELAETIAHMEQQLGQEAMGLILEYFQAEAEAESPGDPRLLGDGGED